MASTTIASAATASAAIHLDLPPGATAVADEVVLRRARTRLPARGARRRCRESAGVGLSAGSARGRRAARATTSPVVCVQSGSRSMTAPACPRPLPRRTPAGPSASRRARTPNAQTSCAYRPVSPLRLLRAHVRGRAENHPGLGHRRRGDRRRCATSIRRVACRRSSAFASPKSSTFTVPSGRTLMLAGFEIAMDDALLVRRFEGLGDLLRDRQRLVDRDRAARDTLRQSSPSTSSMTSAVHARALLQAVDVRDVRVVQRREHFRFALKPREPVGVSGERRGQHLDRDLPFELGVASRGTPRPSRLRQSAR